MFFKRARVLRPMMVLLVVLALMTGACDDNNDLEVDVNGSHPVGVVIS